VARNDNSVTVVVLALWTGWIAVTAAARQPHGIGWDTRFMTWSLQELLLLAQQDVEMSLDWPSEEVEAYFGDRVSNLLAAMRLWAQGTGRDDTWLRTALDADPVRVMTDAADELRTFAAEGEDGERAVPWIEGILELPERERAAVAATVVAVLSRLGRPWLPEAE
jgi:hypothetical protein